VRILVTGGAGYIGSHTCVVLLNAGFELTVFDNLSNSHREALFRVEKITGKTIEFIQGDICDSAALRAVFAERDIQAVIHFAGLKAVGESVAEPLRYYQNNVAGTASLLEVMAEFGVYHFVFSSSATVYGDPEQLPIVESSKRFTTNPYGRTKLVIEQMLEDLAAANSAPWKIVSLRYFNPVGAHESGLIGEDPNGIPNNLMPFISQVAVGRRKCLSVFGSDYNTVDGTGVRDYIHVVDLAEGHLSALNYLLARDDAEILAVNLGTGRGVSVLEMVASFARVSGQPIPYELVERRPGDVAACYADPQLAYEKLGWRAQRDVDAMCADTWRWQSQNPEGY